jgi:hypothetical protein
VAGIDVARRPEHVRQVIGLAGQHAAVEPRQAPYERREVDAVALSAL